MGRVGNGAWTKRSQHEQVSRGADDPVHDEAAGDIFQLFGHVLADPAQAEATLQQDPFAGHLFVFRGRQGDLVKVIWWDGQGACMFMKRLEKGRFVWPSAPWGAPTRRAPRSGRSRTRARTWKWW